MNDLTNALLSMETNQQTLLDSEVNLSAGKLFRATVKVDWNDEEFPIYANIAVVNDDNTVVIPLNNIETPLGLHNALSFIHNVIYELKSLRHTLLQAHWESNELAVKQANAIEILENIENNNINETRKS